MITQAELKDRLDYDPETGVFTRKYREGAPKEWNGRYAGTRAGTPLRPYRRISIDKAWYYEHVLAWLYVYGEFPDISLDHINCDGSDNRIANLRKATPKQNNGNMPLRSDNKSGFKGVYWNKARNSWQANICLDGKTRYLGLFADIEDAKAAYWNAAVESHGEFARAA